MMMAFVCLCYCLWYHCDCYHHCLDDDVIAVDMVEEDDDDDDDGV